MIDITQTFIWLFVGLILTNSFRIIHLKSKIVRYTHLPTTKQIAPKGIKKIALIKSLPYTPFYYLIIWIMCSVFYLQNQMIIPSVFDGLILGVSWWFAVVVIEMLGWVVIKHKYSFSFKQVYVQSQPWISLNYYAILISPIIIAFIVNFNKI